MAGRVKHPLGELFGLANFGVNITRIAPGGVSSLRHAHTKQDEFIYVLEGQPTLHTDEGRTRLSPGMCAGFKAGTGNGHCLINETQADVLYLEVGDRTPGDEGSLTRTSRPPSWTASGGSRTRTARTAKARQAPDRRSDRAALLSLSEAEQETPSALLKTLIAGL